MGRWELRAWEVANQLPARGASVRLLCGGCFHNAGFKFFAELSRALRPDAIVILGDLSGLPQPFESLVLRWAWDTPRGVPTLLAGGNHDSDSALRTMQRKGARVLHTPSMVDLDGLRVWGWRDPNRTRWGRHDAYSPALCRERAPAPPDDGEPYIAAVHCSAMMPVVPDSCRLVLAGHAHVPKAWKQSQTVFARTGTAGGGGLNWPGRVTPRQAMVVDVALPEHRARAVYFVESNGKTATVSEG